MKSLLLKIYSLIYFLIVTSFSWYWSAKSYQYTHIKGDEYSLFAEIILVLTFLFFLFLQFSIGRIQFIYVLIIPFITDIGALFTGVFLYLFLPQPVHNISQSEILLYGELQGLFALVAVFRLWPRTIR